MYTHHTGEKEEKSKTGVGKPASASLTQMTPEIEEGQSGGSLLKLQSSLGNRYVQRLLDGKRPRLIVQPQLRVGPVGDRYEQEADRAAQIAARPDAGLSTAAPRKSSPAPAAGYSIAPEIESRIIRARGNGRPLPRPLRQKMERVFSADFGRVKVHIGETADSLNRSLRARAFTTGQDIFFRRGEYNPASKTGQMLLAHELTHVVQQNGAGQLTSLVQREPIRNEDGTYVDPNIPGATIIATGAGDSTGNIEYRIAETGVVFVFNTNTGKYAVNRSPVDPATLSPFGFEPEVEMEAEPKRTIVAAERDEDTKRRKSTRKKRTPKSAFQSSLRANYQRIVDDAVETIFESIPDFHEYELGTQSATTTAEGEQFKTTAQMHSEMVGLSAMLRSGTYSFSGSALTREGGGDFDFITVEPHCGFCTFFLQLLGLPLTIPTKGKFNLMGNLDYPLPPEVRQNQELLEHFLQHGVEANLDGLVYQVMNLVSDDMTWEEFDKLSYLTTLWKFIFSRIDNYLRKPSKKKAPRKSGGPMRGKRGGYGKKK